MDSINSRRKGIAYIGYLIETTANTLSDLLLSDENIITQLPASLSYLENGSADFEKVLEKPKKSCSMMDRITVYTFRNNPLPTRNNDLTWRTAFLLYSDPEHLHFHYPERGTYLVRDKTKSCTEFKIYNYRLIYHRASSSCFSYTDGYKITKIPFKQEVENVITGTGTFTASNDFSGSFANIVDILNNYFPYVNKFRKLAKERMKYKDSKLGYAPSEALKTLQKLRNSTLNVIQEQLNNLKEDNTVETLEKLATEEAGTELIICNDYESWKRKNKILGVTDLIGMDSEIAKSNAEIIGLNIQALDLNTNENMLYIKKYREEVTAHKTELDIVATATLMYAVGTYITSSISGKRISELTPHETTKKIDIQRTKEQKELELPKVPETVKKTKKKEMATS